MKRCICSRIFSYGDEVVWVLRSKDNILVPLCSLKCGEEYKNYTINKLKEKLKEVESQVLEIEIFK